MSPFTLDIDTIPINIAVYEKVDDDFIFVAFNKEAEKTENITRDKLLGKKLIDIFPGAIEFGFYDILNKVYDTAKTEVYDTTFYCDERISGWRSNKVTKLQSGLIIAFYTDKSIEKELEEKGLSLEKQLTTTETQLEHQKKIFQHIMENSDSISLQGYNEQHEVIYWNKASSLFYGYTQEEALGKKLEELIIPTHMKESVYNAVEDWINNGTAVPSSKLTLKTKSGEDINVYSQHVMIEIAKNHQEMYCIDINLKDIKKLETELNIQQNFMQTIFDVIPDLVWLKDTEGKYLACNHMFERLYGTKEADIIGKTDFDFISKELAIFFRENDKRAIEENISKHNDEYLVFLDGSHEGYYDTTKTAMKDMNGNIIGVLGIARDVNDRVKREKQLEVFALYDELTGLANRTNFLNHLKSILEKRESSNLIHALLFIDLDRFKEINDTMGHSVGDLVLIEVSKRLQSVVRDEDTLSRLGGDEFTVVIENIQDPLVAGKIAQKIINALKEPINIKNNTFFVTASIGISITPTDSTDTDSLVRFADSAMYKAKENGRNSYAFYTQDLSTKALERKILEDNLRSAIKNNEFVLYYQPQVNAMTNKIVGAEALIRWNHPVIGLISPMKFIPIAESSGQILEIGRWVIHQAMRDMKKFKKSGLDLESLSINLSVKQLNDKMLIKTIKEAVLETNCDPFWIEFEVTESYAMTNPQDVIVTLNRIRELNFKLSIDDFGTGYSSLQYLKKLPVNKLKIDQSFVRDIPGNSDDEAIVQAVILIAKSMKLEVIAEGVEDEIQKEILLGYGCNLIQGYLYAKPMPIDEFEKYLISNP